MKKKSKKGAMSMIGWLILTVMFILIMLFFIGGGVFQNARIGLLEFLSLDDRFNFNRDRDIDPRGQGVHEQRGEAVRIFNEMVESFIKTSQSEKQHCFAKFPGLKETHFDDGYYIKMESVEGETLGRGPFSVKLFQKRQEEQAAGLPDFLVASETITDVNICVLYRNDLLKKFYDSFLDGEPRQDDFFSLRAKEINLQEYNKIHFELTMGGGMKSESFRTGSYFDEYIILNDKTNNCITLIPTRGTWGGRCSNVQVADVLDINCLEDKRDSLVRRLELNERYRAAYTCESFSLIN